MPGISLDDIRNNSVKITTEKIIGEIKKEEQKELQLEITKEQYKMLTDFLSIAGTPFIAGRCESSITKTNICQPGTHYPLDALVCTYNVQYPVIVEMAINGGFGEQVKQKLEAGEDPRGVLKGVRTKENTKEYRAFVLDVDTHGERDCMVAAEQTINKLKLLGIEPTAITKKPGGPHIYCLFNPDEVDKITEIIDKEGGRKFFIDFCNFLFGAIPYIDLNVCAPEHMIRLPNTYSRKDSNKEKYGCAYVFNELYQYQNGVLKNGPWDHKLDKFVSFEKFCELVDMYKKATKVLNDAHEESKRQYNKDTLKKINSIDIHTFFNELKRRGPITDHRGRQYYLGLKEGGSICLEHVHGNVELTNGYKWKQNEDGTWFINNFSTGYDIDERPIGGPFTIVYILFKKSITDISKFFEHLGCGISYEKVTEDSKVIEGYNGQQVLFTKEGCYLKQQYISSSGKVSYSQKLLLSHYVEYLGLVDCYTDQNGYITDSPEPTYLFYDKTGKQEFALYRCPKKDLNKILSRYKMCFYGQGDDDISKFLDVLDQSGLMSNKVNIYDDGYYDDMVVMGGQVVYTKPSYNSDNYYISAKKFDIFDGKQVSFKKFIESACEWMDERYVYTIMYGMEWLNLMNIRSELPLLIKSGLYIGGKTKTGKSTAMKMALRGMGYLGGGNQPHERYMQLSGSATPQPIQLNAMISSPLTLDEYTELLNPKISQVIRDCVNGGLAQKGIGSMRNISFVLKAGLLVGGETQLESESVGNRFIQVNLENQTKRGKAAQINETMKLTYRDDFLEMVMNNRENIGGIVEKYLDQLSEDGIEGRLADTWVGIFVMNELHGMPIPYKTLLERVLYHMKGCGVKVDYEEDLTTLDMFMQKIIKAPKREVTIYAKQNDTCVTIVFSDVFFQRNRYIINKVASELNTACACVNVENCAAIKGTALEVKVVDGADQYSSLYSKIYDFCAALTETSYVRAFMKNTVYPSRG